MPAAACPELDALSATTCVVTGGLGFIGSNMAHALASAGARVRVVDALVPEHGGDRRNLEGLEHPERVEVLIADLGEANVAEVLFDADVVFNVAGQVSHLASLTDPLRDLDLNVRSQLAFLETVRSARPRARVVLTSTRQVYGRPERLPVDETHVPRPVDVNGIDKLAAEQLHLLYGRVHGLQATALRLTNVYGPRQCLVRGDLGVLAVFFRRALAGEVIELYGDGMQRRDCVHVDDVVRALALAATTDAAVGEVVNLGHPTSSTLREIAETIAWRADSSGGLRLIPWPEDLARIDIGDFEGDYSRAAQLLGWKPAIDLADGVARTIDFYRRHPWYLSST
ncbi:MAG TPA: NAD-dependent epimerase/dehydratase family protein [Acidimicrobiales bacterium]